MDIVNVEVVDRFARHHRRAKRSLDRWKVLVTNARWSTRHDAEREISGARGIGNRRLTFKIKGNDYRLVALVNYQLGTVQVRFLGTHAAYDDIDAKEV